MEKIPITFNYDDTESYNVPFTLAELEHSLSLSKSKSTGTDNIPYEFLKHLTAEQLSSLLNFYNYVYKTGYPIQWSQGLVIPILKQGKASHLKESYRPITLTNCLSKLLERMVTRRLQEYLESVNFYTCLLYTSPSPRDKRQSRMPSSA